MNKSIWENVEATSNKSGNKIIKLRKIIEEERIECRRLIDYGINYVATQFDRRASLSCINKTSIGYFIQLRCTKSKCNTFWWIQINITNNLNNS